MRYSLTSVHRNGRVIWRGPHYIQIVSTVMFSLLFGLWNYLFTKAEMHILIAGLDDAGKTTLLEQLKSMYGHKPCIPLHKIPPTVGLNIARVELERTRILFWDLGGQERLRAIWSKYYSESHGILFVVDAGNKNRFEEAKRTIAGMLANEELLRVPVIVLANKNDCKNARPIEEIEELFVVQQLTSAPAKHISVSAMTKSGIDEAVQWILHHVRKSERFLTQ